MFKHGHPTPHAPVTPLIAWSRTFPATAQQVGEARRFLATILDGCPAADDALLCLSELATNAVLHSASSTTAGTFTVRAQMSPGHAWIAVEDNGGPWAGHHHQDGREHGLAIVAALATGGWGRDGDALSGWLVWAALEWTV